LRCYKRKSVKVGIFRRGWVTFSEDLGGKGALPTNCCWCESSRVIALSCGIKISAVHHLDSSQSTRVTNRRTDTKTDGQTDRITTPQDCLAYACAIKTLYGYGLMLLEEHQFGDDSSQSEWLAAILNLWRMTLVVM